jgi:hypothetical protein
MTIENKHTLNRMLNRPWRHTYQQILCLDYHHFYTTIEYHTFLKHKYGHTTHSYSCWVPEFVYGDNELLENMDSVDAVESFFRHSKTA